MTHGEHNAALDGFLHRRHDSGDLWRGCDDADAEAVCLTFAGHNPVLVLRKVLCAVDFFEGCKTLVRLLQELRGVRAALGELNKGALCVPAKHRCGIGGGVGAQEVQECRVQRLLLSLG